MWEKLLLDFFKVGQNAAGLSSYWTNEQHSQKIDFENQILVIFVASYPSDCKSNHKNN